MIPRKARTRQPPPWQRILAEAVREVDELWDILDLPRDLLPAARRAAADFPLRLPRPFLARIPRGRPHDPVLRQFLPLGEELDEAPGFVPDPVGDGAARRAPGLLQKYRGRALVVSTGACPVHCRYCFRRHHPYGEDKTDGERLAAALAEGEPAREVILSGGDPLVLGERRLDALVRPLLRLPGLTTLRLHSRTPVILPERLDAALGRWLDGLLDAGLQVVLVIHANHPRELDASVAEAFAGLARPGLTLLNQSVLLRGVNDDAQTLADLSRRLFALGVLPYYLHQLDPVAGAAHFQVPDEAARSLMSHLRAHLPGYLVPRLVREIPGRPNKTPLS